MKALKMTLAEAVAAEAARMAEKVGRPDRLLTRAQRVAVLLNATETESEARRAYAEVHERPQPTSEAFGGDAFGTWERASSAIRAVYLREASERLATTTK
jgi:hypothetical protein